MTNDKWKMNNLRAGQQVLTSSASKTVAWKTIPITLTIKEDSRGELVLSKS